MGLAEHAFGLQLEFPGYTKQADLVRAVAKFSRVACRSGHKTGKTLSVAVLAWWFALTRNDVRVVCTHPTARQVKQTVWREITRLRTMAARNGVELPSVPLDPATGISFPNGSQILGFTVDDPDAFSGISAPEVLYLVDEASGVADAVFEAIAGNLAGGGKLLETGNPTTTSGHFFDAFHEKRHLYKDGALLAISSLESPNIAAGEIVVPGLAAAEWAETMLADYGGPGEPVYDVRVLGAFPSSGPNVVVPLSLLEAAVGRHDPTVAPTGALRIGVDVARFGDDDTVIAWTRGAFGAVARRIHGAPTTEVVGEVRALVAKMRRAVESVVVAIDEGSMGAGVIDQLLEAFDADPHVQILGVNAASSPYDRDRFERRRDELWWDLREWLATATLEPCSELERELVAPSYSLTSGGRIKVEGKDQLKKRLKRSPDHADALALAVGRPEANPPPENTCPAIPWSRWDGMGRGF